MVAEIRTSQDLLDLLDNNEEFRRAARRVLLTDDLLDLPDIVREMQQTQRLMIQRMDRMEERQDRMEELLARVVAQQELTNERLDRMDERQDRTDERQDRMEELLARVVAQQELTNERLDRMDERMDRMELRQDRMEGRQDRMEGRQDRMEATLASMERKIGDIDGRLRGWELERESVAKLLPRLAREYGVVRIKAVSADSSRSAVRVSSVWETRFEEAVDAAFDTGRITTEEEGVLSRTDIVARARRGVDGPEMWFAVQASVTIDNDDIERAAVGAAALRKVSDDDAAGVVYGRRIAAQQRVRAGELGVAVMLDEESAQE